MNSEIWFAFGGRRTSREALKSEIWNLSRWFLWGLTWGFGICNLKSEFWICCSPLEILKVENEIWNLKSALANTDFLKIEICFLHSAFCSVLSLRSGAWKLQLEICWAECWLSEFQFLVTFAFCILTEFRIVSILAFAFWCSDLLPNPALNFEIWNLKSEIWILKSEIWNLKSEIWNLKSEIWNLKSEFWNLKSEIWVLPCSKPHNPNPNPTLTPTCNA